MVDWQHARLRAAASRAAVIAESSDGDSDIGEGAGAGAGTFVVFTSHGRAARAREVLSSVLSPSAVRTAAHNREQGGCFLVHASAADVDRLLPLPADEGDGAAAAGGGGEEGGGGRLFDGFVTVPPSLKLAPSLLDHGGVFAHDFSPDDGAAIAARVPGFVDDFPRDDDDEGSTPKISLGKALRRNNGNEGLVVLLLAPDEPVIDGEGELELALGLADRWRRDWSSPSLNLHGLSFWSDSTGHRAYRHARRGSGEGREEEAGADVLAREWGEAARTVHALGDRLGGVSPGKACGWNDIRVAPESSSRVTLRDIGHLLPGPNPAGAGRGAGGASGDGRTTGIDGEREKTACLMGLVSFLASRPEVARVSALPRAELSNAVAGRIVQGGSATSAPIWGRGVDGSGEVVQVMRGREGKERREGGVSRSTQRVGWCHKFDGGFRRRRLFFFCSSVYLYHRSGC